MLFRSGARINDRRDSWSRRVDGDGVCRSSGEVSGNIDGVKLIGAVGKPRSGEGGIAVGCGNGSRSSQVGSRASDGSEAGDGDGGINQVGGTGFGALKGNGGDIGDGGGVEYCRGSNRIKCNNII